MNDIMDKIEQIERDADQHIMSNDEMIAVKKYWADKNAEMKAFLAAGGKIKSIFGSKK